MTKTEEVFALFKEKLDEKNKVDSEYKAIQQKVVRELQKMGQKSMDYKGYKLTQRDNKIWEYSKGLQKMEEDLDQGLIDYKKGLKGQYQILEKKKEVEQLDGTAKELSNEISLTVKRI